MPLVFSTLRVLTFALGLFFVYLAAFTYETTDTRVRNTLEDLWLKLEFGPRTPAGVAKRLVRVVLSLMDAIFDRVFGAGGLSIRTLARSPPATRMARWRCRGCQCCLSWRS